MRLFRGLTFAGMVTALFVSLHWPGQRHPNFAFYVFNRHNSVRTMRNGRWLILCGTKGIHQFLQPVHWRKFIELVLRRGGNPGKAVSRHCFNEGCCPAVVFQQGGADIDKGVNAFDAGEHPCHAMGAEKMMLVRPMQAANDGIALCDLKGIAGDHGR